MSDTFKTIVSVSKIISSEKRSKFIAYALPVQCIEEVQLAIDKYRKEYYDARHICWAYTLGAARQDFRSNDDGEPSGTAGKPILGQINSNKLTNILLVVIRYFGGVKLGTSGLIQAYREAAAEAIAEAEIIEKTIDCHLAFTFQCPAMNSVMKIIKELEPTILSQSYDSCCRINLHIRQGKLEELTRRLTKIEDLLFIREE